jgi:putative NADH-flavin reductase
VADLSYVPAEFRDERIAVSALVTDDLPATPETLDWVFVSPADKFGSFAPGERLGEYRVGGDVAVQPEDGGAISGADYAIGFVDLIEQGTHHRAHLNLAY